MSPMPSDRSYINKDLCPKPMRTTEMDETMSPTHPIVLPKSRILNQRASALYMEAVTVTASLEAISDPDTAHVATVKVRRIFAAGPCFMSQTSAVNVNILPDTVDSDSIFTLDSNDAVRHELWRQHPDVTTAVSAFVNFTQSWEVAVAKSPVELVGDMVTAKALVSDNPLFVPLSGTDIRTLITKDQPPKATINFAQYHWAMLARALETPPNRDGVTMALSSHDESATLKPTSRLGLILTAITRTWTNDARMVSADRDRWLPVAEPLLTGVPSSPTTIRKNRT